MRAKPAPAWDPGNYTIWEEYVDITFAVANSCVLSITSAVGLAANIFVILAVYHQKSLQTSNNALVVNLAVIDILRCAIDCPVLFTIVIAVHRKGRLDKLVCDAQVAAFSFSCCIQMLTLACISAERYQAITQPFKTSQRKKRITVLIPLTWTLAIVVAVLCLIFVKDSPVYVRCKGLHRDTTSSYDTFGLYMLFPLWAACFGVITGFYARIFTHVRSHNRKIFDKGAVPLAKNSTAEDQQKTKETMVLENLESEQNKTVAPVTPAKLATQAAESSSHKDPVLLTSMKAAQCVAVSENEKKDLKDALEITCLETEQPRPPAVRAEGKPSETEQSTRVEVKPTNGGVKSSTAEPQKVLSNVNTESPTKDTVKINKAPTEVTETSPHVPSAAQLEDTESASVLLIKEKQAEKSNGEETPAVTAEQVSAAPPVSDKAPEADAAKESVQVEGAVCMMPSKASRERANKKKESKMAKRAGYIIITFLLFWLPLITTILVNLVVHKNRNTQIKIIQDVEILSVSVSCVTSLSDPIIYAAVNPQFRTEFYRLRNKVKSTFSKN